MGKNGKTRHEAEWQLIKDAVEANINDLKVWERHGWKHTELRCHSKTPIEIDYTPNRTLIAITLIGSTSDRQISVSNQKVCVWENNQRSFIPGPWYLVLLDEMKVIRAAIEEGDRVSAINRKQLIEDPHLFDDWSVNHD